MGGNDSEVSERTAKYFKPRVSYLDYEVETSAIKRSEFSGWFNCLWVGIVCFAVCRPLVNYIEQGYFIDLHLLYSLLGGIERLFIPLATLFLYSYLAPILQKIVFRFNLSDTLASVLQHSVQTCMFAVTFPLIHMERWPFAQSLAFTVEVMVIFMKMHSYNSGNRDLKLEYESRKKQDSVQEGPLQYPNNLSFANYTYFLLAPTLVYEPAYPMTSTFRPGYFLTQVAAAVVEIYALYILVSEHIQPVLWETTEFEHFPRAIMKLMLPLFACFLLVFYLIFHVICNAAAELTYFADREFYGDWWNSMGWDEFSRKWNKPVHRFLFRHVYLRMINRYHFSKSTAGWCTYLFSAFLHELLLWSVFSMLRPLVFAFMLLQIPLIMVMRPLKGTRIANLIFWFGFYLGYPIISVLYSSEYCRIVQCVPS